MEVADRPQDPMPAPPDLILPPDFQAFCELHRRDYLGYAGVHLGGEGGLAAVRGVLGELAIHWPYVLSRPNPTAHAWRTLTARTRVHRAVPGRAVTPCPVARFLGPLPPAQHDAVVLHCVLDRPPEAAALSMGEDPGRIRSLVREALRR